MRRAVSSRPWATKLAGIAARNVTSDASNSGAAQKLPFAHSASTGRSNSSFSSDIAHAVSRAEHDVFGARSGTVSGARSQKDVAPGTFPDATPYSTASACGAAGSDQLLERPSKPPGLTEEVARNATSDRKLLSFLPAPLARLLRMLLVALLERRGAPPGWCLDGALPAWCLGLEVVLPHILGDLLAQHGSLHVGGAEVDAAPHARADDLLERLREAIEAPRRAGCGTALVADRGERDLVGAEEGLQRVHEGTADAGVPRRVVRKAGGDERRSGDGNRGVEERQPGRVGLG